MTQIQVKSGTTEWKACPSGVPDAGFVLFNPANLIYNADHFTLDMVWDSGLNTLRVRTQAERDAAAQAILVGTRTQAANDYGGTGADLGMVVRALALVTLDEINLLRTNASLPTRTAAQLKTAVLAKLSSGAADTQ